MKNIKISVIIPCYNDGIYLRDAIASLNAQTYKDFEIIIIDDASSDEETINILSQMGQNNIQVIYLEKNSGPAVARNRGIERAKGDYILPLDADDKIAPTYLEKAKKILDDDTKMGIVYCEAEYFGLNMGRWSLPPYSFPEILVGNMIFATAMYRKTDWEAVGGYNENMRHGNEDYDFWLSILELGRSVYQIPEILFSYRIKKSSRTTALASDHTNELNSYMQMFYNHQELYHSNIKYIFDELKTKQLLIQNKNQQILEKNQQIAIISMALRNNEAHIQNQNVQIDYLHQVVSSMRLVSRAKRLVKKIIPQSVLTKIENIGKSQRGTVSGDITIVGGYRYQNPLLDESITKEIATFNKKPLISIVMPVYNVDPKWLDLAIKSVEAQWYQQWELCIADDKSTDQATVEYLKSLNNPKIKIKFLENNLNISGASNEALTLATGDYIALMDNDDEITPDALYEVVKAINKTGAEFIYSDEDKLEMDGTFSDPHFKPDFSPDLLLSYNYITHLGVIKKSLVNQVGAFTLGVEGAQDYDLYLKVLEHTSAITHIQKILYHWRKIPGSTAAVFSDKSYAQEAGRSAISSALSRRDVRATVENGKYPGTYKVRYNINNPPLVSIIIPFRDKPELLTMCIGSILDKSTYSDFEIIGISNNSSEQATFDEMQRLESLDERIKFYEYNVPFNYSDINNHAVNTYAKGEHILLLNNDIEIITPEWIESMLEHSQREEIGCVGAKLYFPNDTIQHAGVIIGLGGVAGHSHKGSNKAHPGYFVRLELIQNLSAVTAACLMVKKSIYNELNGLNENDLKIAFNDVDFCLRVQEAGYLNIFTPYCEAYHHESISRGAEDNPEKLARFNSEVDYMKQRHKKILKNGDPYYNPNLTLDREDFGL